MMTGLSTEVVMTFFFLFVILGVTDKRGFAVFGGLRRSGPDADPSGLDPWLCSCHGLCWLATPSRGRRQHYPPEV